MLHCFSKPEVITDFFGGFFVADGVVAFFSVGFTSFFFGAAFAFTGAAFAFAGAFAAAVGLRVAVGALAREVGMIDLV
jgi:hypothetical protein